MILRNALLLSCSLLAVGLIFAPQVSAQRDTARVADGRVFIEPLGVSIGIPPAWIGVPDTTPGRMRSCVNILGTNTQKNIVMPRDPLQLAAPPWILRRHYSRVADSVVQLSTLVVHLGSVDWMSNDSCGGPHARIYVTTEPEDSIHARARRVRLIVPAQEGGVSPIVAAVLDTAEWRISRASWEWSGNDSGMGLRVLFITRRVKDRTFVLVLMSSSRIQSHEETWRIFQSIRVDAKDPETRTTLDSRPEPAPGESRGRE